jgi:Holliday junction resolvasome RuvABC ATP-dependent DNA helicase subunit
MRQHLSAITTSRFIDDVCTLLSSASRPVYTYMALNCKHDPVALSHRPAGGKTAIQFSTSMSDNNDGKAVSGDVPENAQDLTIFVQNLLEQMVLFI